MDTRRAMVRLGLLAGLLLVYPLGLVALRMLPTPGLPTDGARLSVTATWRPVEGTPGQLSVSAELHNGTARALTLRQAALSVFTHGTPAVTVIEDDPVLRARLPGGLSVPPKGTLNLGTMSVEAPATVDGTVLLSLRLETGEQPVMVTGEAPITR